MSTDNDNDKVLMCSEIVTSTTSCSMSAEDTSVGTSGRNGDVSRLNQQSECAICLQSYVHPVQLPCSHIFCYLCAKGVVLQGNALCAICRSSIPLETIEEPKILGELSVNSGTPVNALTHTSDDFNLSTATSDALSHSWFYKGRRGGWWEYDPRAVEELERSYSQGRSSCQLLIAGFLYEIDFRNMIQKRMNNPSLFRRIKRDHSNSQRKGVAGIRLSPSNPLFSSEMPDQAPNVAQDNGTGTVESPQPDLVAETSDDDDSLGSSDVSLSDDDEIYSISSDSSDSTGSASSDSTVTLSEA